MGAQDITSVHFDQRTVEPRNLLRILKHVREADVLGLNDALDLSESEQLILSSKVQDFARFLLEQLNKESKQLVPQTIDAFHLEDSPVDAETPISPSTDQQPSPVSELFGASILYRSHCDSQAHGDSIRRLTAFYFKFNFQNWVSGLNYISCFS